MSLDVCGGTGVHACCRAAHHPGGARVRRADWQQRQPHVRRARRAATGSDVVRPQQNPALLFGPHNQLGKRGGQVGVGGRG